MAKEKVYKLAQEFKVSSEALVQMLHGMGIPVKSHMSTVDENLRDDIRKKFEQERAEIKLKYERKKQVLVKAREEPAEVAPAPAAAPAATAGPMAPLTTTIPASAPAQSVRRDTVPRHVHAGPAAAGSRFPERDVRRDTYVPKAPDSARFATPTGVSGVLPAGESARKDWDKPKKKAGKKKFEKKPEIAEFELKANVKKTLAKIGSGSTRKKYKKDVADEVIVDESEKKYLHVAEFVTGNELANMMGVNPSEVIAKCLGLGLFITINQRLDFETIELVADEFGYTAQLMTEYAGDEEEKAEEDTGKMVTRAPVVTIMGHVDHGKTSLLDYIRKTNVIAGEAGGITQHIAAYEVKTKHGPVTFLDTPGHEAFTAMRARGSQITDVIVLVVAADDGVMPQTKEAIDHARAANVPIVVALNKMDLSTANPDRVKGELAQYNVLVEDYGGKVSCVPISAKKGDGVDKLLEVLALESEILELKATPEGKARGVVVESQLDKGKGPVATVLIEKGTLRRGDPFVTGIHFGRVRDLLNERGAIVEQVGPSQPVLVLGLDGTPQAGDSFTVVADEQEAREIAGRRRLAQKERELRRIGTVVSLDHLYEQIQAGNVQTINVIIKGDVDGSVEALADSLEKLSTKEIKVGVLHKSVGAIKESDVMLAAASNAIIIGFHLSPNTKIRDLAKREGVDMRTYRIIYEVVDAIRSAMEGMLKPEVRETIIAQVEVRKVFKVSKIGMVAGCFVASGTVTRGCKARLIRDDVVVVETKIATLRRVQDDVKEVLPNQECGITLDKFNEYREGDRIETYEETEIARKLSST
ncbi:MAG: translation initiation factor IF-2 [Chitinispirillaceae bacterium]|jgi:translation initiation factor IF-2|nr:translation initiation factor IF-2 [Chitinispirillaceae bacterium]